MSRRLGARAWAGLFGVVAAVGSLSAARAGETCPEPPSTSVTRAEVDDARLAEEQAKRTEERADERLDEARAAHAAAVVRFDSDGGVQRLDDSLKGVKEAEQQQTNAAAAARCAEREREALEDALWKEEAPFRVGLGVGLSVAGGAGGARREGGSLRLLLVTRRYRLTWDLDFEVSRAIGLVRPTPKDDAGEAALAARARAVFGEGLGTFFVGGGAIFMTPDYHGPILTGQLGGGLRGAIKGGLFDAKLFIEPWLPLDGQPVRVLFGIELGGVLGVADFGG